MMGMERNTPVGRLPPASPLFRPKTAPNRGPQSPPFAPAAVSQRTSPQSVTRSTSLSSGSPPPYHGMGMTPPIHPYNRQITGSGASPKVDLQLQFEQPVESCELKPYAVLRYGDRAAHGSTKIEGLDVAFRWLRCQGSVSKEVQLRVHCNWCNREPVSLQCVQSSLYFCCSSCFLGSWKNDRNKHLHGSPPSHTGIVDGKTSPITARRNSKDDLVSLRDNWVEVGHEQSYTPTTKDVGHILRCEAYPIDVKTQQPVGRAEYVETLTVLQMPKPPAERMMIPTGQFREPRRIGDVAFKIVSYNVLADLYATREMYPYCNPCWLAWSYRKKNLLREILSHQGDILTLQEVQMEHYESFLRPELEKAGYAGVYKQKTREAMGQSGMMDGCAIFYRKDRFVLREQLGLEFNDLVRGQTDRFKQKSAMRRYLKDNVAVVVVLEDLRRPAGTDKCGPMVCIANTHVLCKTDLVDVKMWQVCMLVRELEKFTKARNIPTILCGDLNSQPNSGVYEFLKTGRIRPTHEDLQGDPYSILRSEDMQHSIPFLSAYACAGEPKFTNFTENFVGVLDYIWFSSDRLIARRVLDGVSEEYLSKSKGLPNEYYSSDHIAIAAEFEPVV